MEEIMHTVYLSLGTNLGNRMDNLINAVKQLNASAGKVENLSSVYESKSWGYDSLNNYLNCCVSIQTTLSPIDLLAKLKEIEESMGRIKTSVYTDRIIDIDILFYDRLTINEEKLKIPHPHIEKREFVLSPLAEIAPDLFHEKHFLTIKQLLNNSLHSEDIQYYQGVDKSEIIN